MKRVPVLFLGALIGVSVALVAPHVVTRFEKSEPQTETEQEDRWGFLQGEEEGEAVRMLSHELGSPMELGHHVALASAFEAIQELPVDRLAALARTAYSQELLVRGFPHPITTRTLLMQCWLAEQPEEAIAWWLEEHGEDEVGIVSAIAQALSLRRIAHAFVAADPQAAHDRLRTDYQNQESVFPGMRQRLWRAALNELLHQAPEFGLEVWRGLPLEEKRSFPGSFAPRAGLQHALLAGQLEDGAQETDRALMFRIVDHWLFHDGDAAFTWIGKELTMEERIDYCAVEGVRKEIPDGSERWQWMKKRLDVCRIRRDGQLDTIAESVGWRSPGAFAALCEELSFDHQRDEARSAAALGGARLGMVTQAIELLHQIQRETVRLRTYRSMLFAAPDGITIRELWELIDEFPLDEREKQELRRRAGSESQVSPRGIL